MLLSHWFLNLAARKLLYVKNSASFLLYAFKNPKMLRNGLDFQYECKKIVVKGGKLRSKVVLEYN